MPVSWPRELRHKTRGRSVNISGSVYRDVPHGTARLCHYHVGCGQAQIHLSCPRWNRFNILRDAAGWYVDFYQHQSKHICPVQRIANHDDEQLGDYYTGGSLNPARSLGPDVINADFPGYHWIYWVGPLLGSLLASSFYAFLRLFQYQTVNPGQDADDVEKSAAGTVANGTENPTSSHSRVMSDTSTLVHPTTPITPMTP